MNINQTAALADPIGSLASPQVPASMRELTAMEIDAVAGGAISLAALGVIIGALGIGVAVGLFVYEEYTGEPDPTQEWDFIQSVPGGEVRVNCEDGIAAYYSYDNGRTQIIRCK